MSQCTGEKIYSSFEMTKLGDSFRDSYSNNRKFYYLLEKFRVGESLDINPKISYLYGKIVKFLHIVFSLCSERSNKLQLSILSPHLNKLNTVTLPEKVYIYLRFLKAKNLWDDNTLEVVYKNKSLEPHTP